MKNSIPTKLKEIHNKYYYIRLFNNSFGGNHQVRFWRYMRVKCKDKVDIPTLFIKVMINQFIVQQARLML